MDGGNSIRVTFSGRPEVANMAALEPAIAEGVRVATEHVQTAWASAATRGISGIEPTSNSSYIQGIHRGLEVGVGGNPHVGRVVNSSRFGHIVEDGIRPFDMKPGLLLGLQARRGKHGLYNIVPFRWGTPRVFGSEAGTGDQRATLRSMPAEVYDVVRDFERSERTGSYMVPAWNFLNVFSRGAAPAGPATTLGGHRTVFEYRWGQRLNADQIPGHLQGGMKPHHKTSPYEGMVRMVADEGTMHKRSVYLTFRTVSSRSAPSSWQHPGTKGKPFSQAVIEAEADNVRRIFRAITSAATGAN